MTSAPSSLSPIREWWWRGSFSCLWVFARPDWRVVGGVWVEGRVGQGVLVSWVPSVWRLPRLAGFDARSKDQVRKLRQAGMGLSLIAAELGLNVNTVKSWCRRNQIRPTTALNGVVVVADVVGCIECGARLSGRQKRFCSDACRREWWKAHPDQINRRAFYTFTCHHCGTEFKAYGNQGRKYCTHACYIRDRFNTRGGRP